MTTTLSDTLSANVPNEGSSPETSTLILHEIWLLHFTSSADALSLLTIDGISLPASPYNSAPGLFDISCVETVVPYSENKWTAFSTALSKWINASQHAVAMTERSNYGGEGGGWHREATVLMFLPLAKRKKSCMVVTIAFDGG
ncbi:hypothetical protein H0E87_026675 [Populus deltoides]|uniref:Uncharacterized protein n=1 Tax=Populus deltoides TaxID=3696 RepID=A0A8T2WXU4_POPDE|nr:hypothetical protein H0E87_026675 [Populus deltoides]